MNIEDQIILGIDPGTTIMGFGLIKVQNRENKKKRSSARR